MNLNKKILLISDNKVIFTNLFIKKEVYLNSSYLTYINNDIQYGSRYILKRVMDLVIAFFIALLFSIIITIIHLLFFIIIKIILIKIILIKIILI